jgi:stage II sporulation protein AA (anti-sigma F factor antagonist)
MAIPFSLESTDHDGVRHLTLAGEVDISCADEIVERALEALNNARIETLVIELAKVTFMDSSGIGALFRINAEADKSGKSMTLRAVPRQVRELLTITGLDLLIPIEDPDASPDPR